MSYDIKGLSCVHCKAYLFEEDDVVICPVCGAPHHRTCYDSIGKCALEELHGTENEYKKPEINDAKTEENKKEPINNAPPFGTQFGGQQFQMFDLLGGIPRDYKFDENVTADDVKKFVFSNTHRYIPKFVTLSKKKKSSWNWAAFFFTCPWLFSRKMYKLGIITGLLGIVSTILAIPFNIKLSTVAISNIINYPEVANAIFETITKLDPAALIMFIASVVLSISVSVVFGIFADYWYKNYTVSSIKNIKKNSDDIADSYRKKGGVNIFFFFIAYFLLDYISSFIVMLF